jgi:hypothetical protein
MITEHEIIRGLFVQELPLGFRSRGMLAIKLGVYAPFYQHNDRAPRGSSG